MFVYYGSDQRIKRGITLAERFMAAADGAMIATTDPGFPKFAYSNCMPKEIWEAMRSDWQNRTTVVRTYSPRNWLGFKIKSNVLAYTVNGKEFFLNANNLDRSDASICGTLIHEFAHVVDNNAAKLSFGHGDNSPNQKDTSYPYWIGSKAKKWAERNSL